jgi:hypothetical protein
MGENSPNLVTLDWSETIFKWISDLKILRFSHRNLRTRTSTLAQVVQIFGGKEHLVKKSADLHPRQGNLLQRSNFSAAYKTSLNFTK